MFHVVFDFCYLVIFLSSRSFAAQSLYPASLCIATFIDDLHDPPLLCATLCILHAMSLSVSL